MSRDKKGRLVISRLARVPPFLLILLTIALFVSPSSLVVPSYFLIPHPPPTPTVVGLGF